MRILVDMDGVIADYGQGFYDTWQRLYPHEIAIPPHEARHFYNEENYPSHLLSKVAVIDEQKGFFLNLPPVPGSIEALHYLLNAGHDVHICTTPLVEYENCIIEKYKWVDRHLGLEWVKRIITTRDKTLIRGDILIDDRPAFIGQVSPQWEYVLFDQPYNRDINGFRRVNWQNYKDILGL